MTTEKKYLDITKITTTTFKKQLKEFLTINKKMIRSTERFEYFEHNGVEVGENKYMLFSLYNYRDNAGKKGTDLDFMVYYRSKISKEEFARLLPKNDKLTEVLQGDDGLYYKDDSKLICELSIKEEFGLTPIETADRLIYEINKAVSAYNKTGLYVTSN